MMDSLKLVQVKEGRWIYRFITLIFFLFTPLSLDASSSALEQEAHALFFSGSVTKSIQAYRKAIEADPSNLSPYLNLSTAYRSLSKYDLALESLENALQLVREDSDILKETGWVLRFLRRPQEAVPYFEEALKVKPKDLDALLGLGVVQLESKESKKAIRTLKFLSELRPTFGGSAYFLSKAYQQDNRLEEARDQYKLALRKDWTLRENKSTFEVAPKKPMQLPELTLTPVEPLGPGLRGKSIQVGLWASSSGRPPRLGSLTLEFSGPFKLVGQKSGKTFATTQTGERWVIQSTRKGVKITSSGEDKVSGIFYGIKFEPLDSQSTFLVQGAKNTRGGYRYIHTREFRGSITIYPQRRGRQFYVVNELPIEEYLLGVLPSEMPHYWPMEALKAQAVIARNYALLKKNRMRSHRRRNFHLCDTQHCQVYKGVRQEKEGPRQAVLETSGKTLTHRGRIVYSYYHSTCGGFMRSSSEAKWGSFPYLDGHADIKANTFIPTASPWALSLWMKEVPPSNCNDPELIPNSEYRWLRVVSASTIQNKLRRFRLGRIKEIIPLSRGKSGHINEVLIRGTRRSKVLKKEHRVRHYLGDESIRSSLFVVDTYKDEEGKPQEFWFYGGGWGHGIGLCQAGAAGLAKNEEKGFEEILKFYYPGSEIKN